MLSLFPDLLTWSWNVPFVFRIYLGIYALMMAYTLYKKGKVSGQERWNWYVISVLLLAMGTGYIVGIYAQALGAIGFVSSLIGFYLRGSQKELFHESVSFYLLLSLVSLSLVFLGAGPHAIDLPL